MVSDELGKQLHDKATRSLALSDDERAQLDAWYVLQDEIEAQQIINPVESEPLSRLHDQVEITLDQLQTTTHHIQELVTQNDALRHEIAHLKRQLAHATKSQAA